MGTLVAGEGGAAVVAASLLEPRPAALAAEGLARPVNLLHDLPVHPLEALPGREGIDRVLLLESEGASAEDVRRWSDAHGVAVERTSTPVLDPPDGVHVVAVSAATTGAGKTPLTRRIARGLRRSGVAVGVVLHPVVNRLLWDGAHDVEVLRGPDDLARPRAIDEEEEIAPVLGTGAPVVAGTEPRALLAAAAAEAGEGGVVLWDGGGAAPPWVRPEVHLFVVDLLRPVTDEVVRRAAEADVLVLAKADVADPDLARERERAVRAANPDASVLLMDLPPAVPEGPRLRGRRVVVVEDWRSLLLGGLSAGAGAVAARRFKCGVVDPRPFATGAIATALERHPHVAAVIPALGRTPEEIAHLAASVTATPGDAVLWASAASPDRVLSDERRPILRVFPEMMEVAGGSLQDVFRPILEQP